MHAEAPAFYVNRHKLRWQDITNATTIAEGQNAHAPAAGADMSQTNAVVKCMFTIATSTVFELQHRCQTTRATNGFGVATGIGSNEIYARVELIKTA